MLVYESNCRGETTVKRVNIKAKRNTTDVDV